MLASRGLQFSPLFVSFLGLLFTHYISNLSAVTSELLLPCEKQIWCLEFSVWVQFFLFLALWYPVKRLFWSYWSQGVFLSPEIRWHMVCHSFVISYIHFSQCAYHLAFLWHPGRFFFNLHGVKLTFCVLIVVWILIISVRPPQCTIQNISITPQILSYCLFAVLSTHLQPQ